MMVTIRRDMWSHTCVARRLEQCPGSCNVKRQGIREEIKGVIYLADAEDKSLERHNLTLLRDANVPCWPDPVFLLSLGDRHDALRKAKEFGLVDHPIWQGEYTEYEALLDSMPMPFVLKTGKHHQGRDKHLVTKVEDLPYEWDGIASAEPYFDGVSYRVLVAGDQKLIMRIDNEDSWIKNSPGADVTDIAMPNATEFAMAEHAMRCTELFGLELAGVDYVIDDDEFKFLETNWYPGISVGGKFEQHISKFLNDKLASVEAAAI